MHDWKTLLIDYDLCKKKMYFIFDSSVYVLMLQDVTLHELMDEEDVLQECKVQNKKLID
jgi:hypothetical protein